MATATGESGAQPGLAIRPTGSALGAEICGVDLAADLSDEMIGAIRDAWHEHLVLLFRGQTLDDERLIAFGRRFGELHRTEGLAYGGKPDGTAPEIEIISNQPEDGVPPGARPSDEATWHTDMSMFEKPASASILYAVDVPSGVGRTRFANLYQAWETLPAEIAGQVEEARSIHDFAYTAMGELRAGFESVTDKSKGPGAAHPIVRTHPGTGRKALYLGRNGYGYILGRKVEDSDRLLTELWVHMTRPEFVWHHDWRNGDVVMWDNRCCTHAREAFDSQIPRRLRRVTVLGEIPV
jgi:taurine dioxygenase